MQIQSLRYIAEIAKVGSINKAAQNLYISQPHLSRILKEVEQSSNIIIFQRTHRGVELTKEGVKFMEHVNRLLDEYSDLENEFFHERNSDPVTIKVATQRYSVMLRAFLLFYQRYCAEKEYLNLAFYEDNMDGIINLVSQQIYNIGVIHTLQSQETALARILREKHLRGELIDDSPICVQINSNHPLADRTEISIDELADYPHIMFADESVTNINYYSDVQQYSKSKLKKRIIVHGRGALHSFLEATDCYHLGSDCSLAGDMIPGNMRYIPLAGSRERLHTYWIWADGQPMTESEQTLLDTFREIIRGKQY